MKQTLTVQADRPTPRIEFGLGEMRRMLSPAGWRIEPGEPGESPHVALRIDPQLDIPSEGFRIVPAPEGDTSRITIESSDDAGAMIGLLDLAERILSDGIERIEEYTRSPYMPLRGIKFNIPLDVRSPSYSDASDAAQNNIAEMWNFEFWREFLDEMARHRYNYLSLWSLHPFPSLVKVPEYPDIALDDVKRSAGELQEHYDLRGRQYGEPAFVEKTETLLKMTIDEKIDFWRRVMAYGKDRNIIFHFITWNIYTYGIEGKYGITDELDNAITRDYFRCSIREMFTTYPDLAGIGLAVGENMPIKYPDACEEWACDVYGRGVIAAADACPGRKITFVHRQHGSKADEIIKFFKPLKHHPNVEFVFSFKYAAAHVYNCARQPYHEEFVETLGDLKTMWTLRNDDVYRFRWFAPGFVRDFIGNIPHDVSAGYYYGSDGYTWGREFTEVEPDEPRQIEIVKHRFHWMLWGRLGYDPETSDERFRSLLSQAYPDLPADRLFDAWSAASMIYPVTSAFHYGRLDFQWYIEGCKSRPTYIENGTGFNDVEAFIELPVHPCSGNVSIPDYAEAVAQEREVEGTTPLQVADELDGLAEKALAFCDEFDGEAKETIRLLADIRAVALMGKYYAHKIAGATAVGLLRATGDEARREQAVEQLTRAAECWDQFADQAMRFHRNPLWLNRVGICDWKQIGRLAREEIAAVESGELDAPARPPIRHK